MEIKDRLIKARIRIQNKNPFFAYLSLFLKFQEKKDLPKYAGCGVDIDGNFYYKKEFVDGISDKELEGVIIHEILHLVLLHLLRTKERNMEVWNIATDIVVNQVIVENGFSLPDGCLLPRDNKIKIDGITIQDINHRTAEEIYDMLGENIKRIGFDEHYYSKGGQTREKKEEWLNRIEEAYVSSKMKGKLPLGIERLIGKLHESKIKWRDLLYRYITSYIPFNYTWNKPNKKSVSADVFMPDFEKERISVVVAIDTSGSIGQEELNDFLSEIVGIAKGFSNRIKMDLITCDAEIQDVYEVENGSINEIKKIKIKGGGGTEFQPVIDYAEKNIKDMKVLVYLTDGYGGEINKKGRYDILWILSKKGDDNIIKKYGKVIKLK